MRHMVARLLLAIAAVFLPQHALAAEAAGDWIGTLEPAPGVELRLAIHVRAGDGGALEGTLDSIDQGAFGIPLGDIEASDDRLVFRVPAVNGRFEGAWNAERNGWAGEWSQGGAGLPLLLARPSPPAPLPANWSIPGNDEIGGLLERRIADRPGAGLVVGIVEPSGRRIVAGGPAGGTEFDGDTLFEIGSMTKVFTALLLSDMVERGEVALDDPADKYLPEGATMPRRNGRKITLLDLATHRSGLPRLPDNLPMSDIANPYADYSEALLLDFLSRYELPRDIGSRYEYSNLGMGLLGYLLARRHGTDYETLLEERITRPLGMNDTVIALDPGQRARFAPGHDMYMRPTEPWDIAVLVGAGGIHSTAKDMMTFLEAFIKPRSTALTPAIEAMFSRRWPAMGKDIDTALGWLVAKTPAGDIVMHNGGTGGFRSNMAFDPQRNRGVVLLTNATAEPAVDDLSMHLLTGAAVAEAPKVPTPPPPAPERTAVTLPPGELDRVVGRYELVPGMVLDISREDEGLMAQVTGQPRFPIYPQAPLSFFWKVVDAQVRFTTDASGKVTGAVLIQNGVEIPGKRIGP